MQTPFGIGWPLVSVGRVFAYSKTPYFVCNSKQGSENAWSWLHLLLTYKFALSFYACLEPDP